MKTEKVVGHLRASPRGIPHVVHRYRRGRRFVPIDLNLPRPGIGYNSHGTWSTIGELRELEANDRENEFPDLRGYPNDTPAIWITRRPRMALRYAFTADTWSHFGSDEPLTPEEIIELRGISKIRIEPRDRIVIADGDDGLLLIRPGRGA